MHDLSLTLTQFCTPVKTALFYRVYETLPQRLRDSLGSKHCSCTITNLLTYFLHKTQKSSDYRLPYMLQTINTAQTLSAVFLKNLNTVLNPRNQLGLIPLSTRRRGPGWTK